MQTKVSYPTAGFVGIFYIYISPSRKQEKYSPENVLGVIFPIGRSGRIM